MQFIPDGESARTVTAVPSLGAEFVRWSDGVMTATRTDNSVSDNIEVHAEFKRVTDVFSLKYSAGTGGTIQGEANQEVLMYNGHLRKLKDIKRGDVVMGWTSEIDASKRRFCPSTVEEVFTRRANVKKISLANGTTLVCTPEHNWYTHKGDENPYRRVTLETSNAPRADAYLVTQAWDSDYDET